MLDFPPLRTLDAFLFNFRLPPMRPALKEEPHNLQETRRANIDALGRDLKKLI